MRNPILVKRYTEGLAAALKSEAEFALVFGEIAAFAKLLESHPRLGGVLLRPFLATAKKAAIVREVLEREGVSPKTRRFLLLLVQHRRLEILSSVVRDLPAMWKERQGVRTFEVRSAFPLSDRQKARLEAELRRLEEKPVHCAYGLDPGLVGGLLVKRGNLVYDVSLKGQLERLISVIKER
jgi:F-type H+-transporting ATPase subunit delta